MYSIDILLIEHDNILRFTNVIENICVKIIEGEILDINIFKKAVIFMKEYADNYHHKKEENILFKYMLENLGSIAKNLISSGMLVEHDLARLHILEIENAIISYEKNFNTKDKLSIISNMMAYVYLLRRHIEKENKLVYTYAEKNLNKDILDKIDLESEEIEKINKEKNNCLKYLDIIDMLEKLY